MLADDLEESVHVTFAPGGCQRYATSGGQNAAVCWLMPPFTSPTSAPLIEANYTPRASRNSSIDQPFGSDTERVMMRPHQTTLTPTTHARESRDSFRHTQEPRTSRCTPGR